MWCGLLGPDVHCRCIDPGLLLSRANLTFRSKDGSLIRGQNANLSVISAKVQKMLLSIEKTRFWVCRIGMILILQLKKELILLQSLL